MNQMSKINEQKKYTGDMIKQRDEQKWKSAKKNNDSNDAEGSLQVMQ